MLTGIDLIDFSKINIMYGYVSVEQWLANKLQRSIHYIHVLNISTWLRDNIMQQKVKQKSLFETLVFCNVFISLLFLINIPLDDPSSVFAELNLL